MVHKRFELELELENSTYGKASLAGSRYVRAAVRTHSPGSSSSRKRHLVNVAMHCSPGSTHRYDFAEAQVVWDGILMKDCVDREWV